MNKQNGTLGAEPRNVIPLVSAGYGQADAAEPDVDAEPEPTSEPPAVRQQKAARQPATPSAVDWSGLRAATPLLLGTAAALIGGALLLRVFSNAIERAREASLVEQHHWYLLTQLGAQQAAQHALEHYPIQFVSGPRGQPGAQGRDGHPGPRGLDGRAGPRGAAGLRGPMGLRGLPGLAGPRGLAGAPTMLALPPSPAILDVEESRAPSSGHDQLMAALHPTRHDD